ncbi:MAG: hypothetical protein ACAH65_08305 [Chloroflexota bacterium]
MSDPLDQVLELVAAGRLSADEAAPILDALAARDKVLAAQGKVLEARGKVLGARDEALAATSKGSADARPPQVARIEVRDAGRRVVDLRIPISLGRFALGRVPGLSADHLSEIREALASGASGPILDVQDADGDGVRIVLE